MRKHYIAALVAALFVTGCCTSTLDAAAVTQNEVNVKQITAQNAELLSESGKAESIKAAFAARNEAAVRLAGKLVPK